MTVLRVLLLLQAASITLAATTVGNPEEVASVIVEHLNSVAQFRSVVSLVDAAISPEGLYINREWINWVLWKLPVNTMVTIDEYHSIGAGSAGKRFFNVFFVDSEQSLLRIIDVLSPKLFDFSGYFMVVFTQSCDVNTRLVFGKFWELYVINCNLLKSTADEIQVHTFLPFLENFCEQTVEIVWNTYKNGSFHDPSKKMFPIKAANFNGCPLMAALFKTEPFTFIDESKQGESRFSGIDVVLLKFLSTHLNFKLVPIEVPGIFGWGKLAANGSASGAMGLIMNGVANLTIGYFGKNQLRDMYMTGTYIYHYSYLVLITSSGVEYQPFEKLFLPFAWLTWGFVLTMFMGSILLFVVLSHVNRKIRQFILGSNNRHPVLNLTNTCLGGSMPLLPYRNFARYLLILWIVYSLVIRTTYQQSLFNIMQSRASKRPINTVNELVAADYKLYLASTQVYVFDNLPMLRERIEVVPDNQIQRYRHGIKDGTIQNAAMLIWYEYVQYHNNFGQVDRNQYHMLQEKLRAYTLTIYLRKHSFIRSVFDQALKALSSTGLVQNWVEKFAPSRTLRPPPKEHQKLSVNHLLGGLDLLFGGLAISLLVFLLELLSKRMQVLKPILETM